MLVAELTKAAFAGFEDDHSLLATLTMQDFSKPDAAIDIAILDPDHCSFQCIQGWRA